MDTELEERLEGFRAAVLVFDKKHRRATTAAVLIEHLAMGGSSTFPLAPLRPPIPSEVRSWFHGDSDEPVPVTHQRLSLTCERLDWACAYPQHVRSGYASSLVRSVWPYALQRQDASFPLPSDQRLVEADLCHLVDCLASLMRCSGICWQEFKTAMHLSPAPVFHPGSLR